MLSFRIARAKVQIHSENTKTFKKKIGIELSEKEEFWGLKSVVFTLIDEKKKSGKLAPDAGFTDFFIIFVAQKTRCAKGYIRALHFLYQLRC